MSQQQDCSTRIELSLNTSQVVAKVYAEISMGAEEGVSRNELKEKIKIIPSCIPLENVKILSKKIPWNKSKSSQHLVKDIGLLQ